jgi:hypothetical protein
MAVVIWGERTYGRIEEFEGTCVATRMGHLYFVPIGPHRGQLVFKDAQGRERAFTTRIDRRSLLVVYARWWSPIAAIVALVAVAKVAPGALPVAFLAALVAVIAVQIAMSRVGRLSEEEKAHRRVYRDLTGLPFDAGLLATCDPNVRARVHAGLSARARTLDASAYRRVHDPEAAWAEIALEPMVRDAAYLCGAFTLARIDRALTSGADRARLDRVHDEIWKKLAPILAAAPVDWSAWHEASTKARGEAKAAAEDRGEGEAAAGPKPASTTVANAAPPLISDLGAMRAGATFERGWNVTVKTNAYRPSTRCAACDAEAPRSYRTGKGRVAIDVPYCDACAAQAHYGWSRKPFREVQGALLFGGAMYGVLAALPFVPLAAAVVVSSLAALAGAIGWMKLFPIRTRAASSATIDGARVVSSSGDTATLFCTHEAWARALAEQHGTTPVARTRPHRAFWHQLGVAPLGAPIAAFFVWGAANPDVHVDNGFREPVQIWVDGHASIVVPPTVRSVAAVVPIHFGDHVLGWSAVGASAPMRTLHVHIDLLGRHLYVPDARLCHLLEVTLYGSQTSMPVKPGPLPVQEFHTLPRIDTWFGDNPKSIESKKGGESRVALQRWEGCEVLTTPPCPEGERARYWSCVAAGWLGADPQRRAAACEDETARLCAFDTDPNAKNAK